MTKFHIFTYVNVFLSADCQLFIKKLCEILKDWYLQYRDNFKFHTVFI